MSFVKYSIGGKITGIQDKEGYSENENLPEDSMADERSYLVVCKKCGIQHMILPGELDRTCFCGNTIKLKELS